MDQIKSYVTKEFKEKIKEHCERLDISISTFVKLSVIEMFKQIEK